MRSLNVSKTKEELKEFYNSLAEKAGPDWQYTYMMSAKHQRERIQKTLEILRRRVLPTHSILDLGCANGELTCVFGLHANKGSVVGVDISDIALNSAPSRYNVSYVESDITDFLKSCTEDQFDIVVATEVLEHIPNYAEVIRLMRKVGRYILVSVPVNEEPNEDAFNINKFGKETKMGDATGHIHHFDRDTLEFHFNEILDEWTNGIHLILGGN